MLPICSTVGARPFRSRNRSSHWLAPVIWRTTSFMSLTYAPDPLQRVAETRLQPPKDAVSEGKDKHRANPADGPGAGMLDAAEIQHVLVHPDQIAERIEVKHRAEHRRHPLRQIRHRSDV